jgi:hypothetical protein
LSLSDIVALVMHRCSCSASAAKEALRQAGREGLLDASGLIPLSVHPDPIRRAAHPHWRREPIGSAVWDKKIDWEKGTVDGYSTVLIGRHSIENWLTSDFVTDSASNNAKADSPGKRAKASRPTRERAKRALNAIYPTGIPEETIEPNAILCRNVGKWLKSQNLLGVSDATILRAANRRP